MKRVRKKGKKRLLSSSEKEKSKFKRTHSEDIDFLLHDMDLSLDDGNDYEEFSSPLWVWEDDEWRLIRQLEKYIKKYEDTSSSPWGKFQS